jgi:transcriptional regulator with GAF, ATPase, and Fis domain
MITVNCAAIPRTLIESEFFGHEKGSFTGATAKRRGRFALADRGTIFLDEIGELSIDMQSKLLRVLQEGDFEPLGSSSSVRVDVRVIAATNRKLEREIGRGNFREDLYYRLNVFPISIPPLRERGDDVVKLASYFTQKFCRRMGSSIKILNQRDIESLRAYHWPGNVRELQNVIERAVIISRGDQIDMKGVIPVAFKKGPSDKVVRSDSTLKRILSEEEIRQMEKDNLMFALETTGWRVSGEKGAARLLGMNPSTFASRMKKYGIKRP